MARTRSYGHNADVRSAKEFDRLADAVTLGAGPQDTRPYSAGWHSALAGAFTYFGTYVIGVRFENSAVWVNFFLDPCDPVYTLTSPWFSQWVGVLTVSKKWWFENTEWPPNCP